MADAMYEQLKAKQAAAASEPDMGMMPPPAADAAMGMDMGMMEGAMPMEGEMPMPTEEEATMLAEEGRGGDIVMGHLTPGELVIPTEMIEDPEIMAVLEDAFNAYDMDMERYVVGSQANSINPDTGYPEFFDQDYAMRMQLQSQQFQQLERMAARDDAWALAGHNMREAEKNRAASARASVEAAARQRQATQAANQRAAQLRAFNEQQRVKKMVEAQRAAKERRGFEKLQVTKGERRLEQRQRGKTLAAGAAAESSAQVPKGKKFVAKRAARRTAPVRAYTTPGSGGGKYTAAGKRPV